MPCKNYKTFANLWDDKQREFWDHNRYKYPTQIETQVPVIEHRSFVWGEEHTLEEIGDLQWVGKERIRQIEAAALRKLRKKIYMAQRWLKNKEEFSKENIVGNSMQVFADYVEACEAHE